MIDVADGAYYTLAVSFGTEPSTHTNIHMRFGTSKCSGICPRCCEKLCAAAATESILSRVNTILDPQCCPTSAEHGLSE